MGKVVFVLLEIQPRELPGTLLNVGASIASHWLFPARIGNCECTGAVPD